MSELALFEEPEGIFTQTRWTVKEVSPTTIRRWASNWHYSHKPPGGGTIGYGIFAPDMVCLVTVSNATNVSGIAAKYGLQRFVGNMEISRVVAHPQAPKNTPSRAIASCYALWRSRGLEWLFSYADTGQQHHGGIYQALNAVYVGMSPAERGYTVNGVAVHPRSLVSRFGTRAWPTVQQMAAEQGDDLQRVDGLNTAKHTYILPIGTPRSRRDLRLALNPYTKPYPGKGK